MKSNFLQSLIRRFSPDVFKPVPQGLLYIMLQAMEREIGGECPWTTGDACYKGYTQNWTGPRCRNRECPGYLYPTGLLSYTSKAASSSSVDNQFNYCSLRANAGLTKSFSGQATGGSTRTLENAGRNFVLDAVIPGTIVQNVTDNGTARVRTVHLHELVFDTSLTNGASFIGGGDAYILSVPKNDFVPVGTLGAIIKFDINEGDLGGFGANFYGRLYFGDNSISGTNFKFCIGDKWYVTCDASAGSISPAIPDPANRGSYGTLTTAGYYLGTHDTVYTVELIDFFGYVQDFENALLQISLATADGQWLDFWGDYFGIPRLFMATRYEEDDDYKARMLREITRAKGTKSILLEEAIKFFKSEYVTIIEYHQTDRGGGLPLWDGIVTGDPDLDPAVGLQPFQFYIFPPSRQVPSAKFVKTASTLSHAGEGYVWSYESGNYGYGHHDMYGYSYGYGYGGFNDWKSGDYLFLVPIAVGNSCLFSDADRFSGVKFEFSVAIELKTALELETAGYTNCIVEDIGKQVKDDGANIGRLTAYDNILKKWWIDTSETININSVMTLEGLINGTANSLSGIATSGGYSGKASDSHFYGVNTLVDNGDLWNDFGKNFATLGALIGSVVTRTLDGKRALVTSIATTGASPDDLITFAGTEPPVFYTFDEPYTITTGGRFGGTATSGSTTKLIDITKNFVTLGAIANSVVTRTADGKYATVTSVSTTTNPNDTLNFASSPWTPTFGIGDAYTIVIPTVTLIDTTKNFTTLGVIAGFSVVAKTSDGKYATVAYITTTTNPNDTLNFAPADDVPTFMGGEAYTVYIPSSTALMDSTKNFTALGVVTGVSVVTRTADGKYATVTSITSSSGGTNDTLNFAPGPGTPTFDVGDAYTVTITSLTGAGIAKSTVGYTNCVPGDIGKQIEDDGAAIGVLVSYDNASRTWRVNTSSGIVVATGSEMSIASGTGWGIANLTDGNGIPASPDGTYKWEYWDGLVWKDLVVRWTPTLVGLSPFSCDGYVNWKVPADWERADNIPYSIPSTGALRYWVRCKVIAEPTVAPVATLANITFAGQTCRGNYVGSTAPIAGPPPEIVAEPFPTPSSSPSRDANNCFIFVESSFIKPRWESGFQDIVDRLKTAGTIAIINQR